MEKLRKVFALDILLVLVFLSFRSLYPETRFSNWKFDNHYKKRLIFLHSFVNYELDSSWQIDWQREYFRMNGLKLSFGSVTAKNLNSSIEAVINNDLGKGWYFRAEFNQIKQRMKHEPEYSSFMGFEKNIFKNFSIFSQCNPTYDKEDIDLLLGYLHNE